VKVEVHQGLSYLYSSYEFLFMILQADPDRQFCLLSWHFLSFSAM